VGRGYSSAGKGLYFIRMNGGSGRTKRGDSENLRPATIRHNHVKISLIRGLETFLGAQVSNEPTNGVSSRRNDIRWESQNCFRLTGGADCRGAVTDFDVTVVSPHSVLARQICATVSRTHSDLPPDELVKKLLSTVMDRKHQDKVARLPPQGDTRATFHPLVFTTGGSIGDATWDTIQGCKASFCPGAFDLMMRRMSVALLRARGRTLTLVVDM